MSKIEEIKKARLAGVEADLKKYGIEGTTEVLYNPSYDELFKLETLPTLEGFIYDSQPVCLLARAAPQYQWED